MTHVFGLTGGIASGKSTVGRYIAALGIPVVDADKLARDAVLPHSPALAAIAKRFGQQLIDETGALRRSALGELVFGKPDELAALNAIVHPEVARLAVAAFARLAQAGHQLICYEVPLLFESNLDAAFRPVVLVATPPHVQLERLRTRDGLDDEQARARVASQLPLEDKRRRADYVIDNHGSLVDLEAATALVVRQIRQKQGPRLDGSTES